MLNDQSVIIQLIFKNAYNITFEEITQQFSKHFTIQRNSLCIKTKLENIIAYFIVQTYIFSEKIIQTVCLE